MGQQSLLIDTMLANETFGNCACAASRVNLARPLEAHLRVVANDHGRCSVCWAIALEVALRSERVAALLPIGVPALAALRR